MKKIYLDNSATTPVDKKVLSEMAKYWSVDFANPSSIHSMGVLAKNALQSARKKIADIIAGHDREIVFISGGTEANNLAIFGVVNNLIKNGTKYSDIHLITTEIEHSSILECFKKLESIGCKVDYLKVDEFGIVDPKDLRKLIKPETVLVSIGYANSEIGVIQPIKEIIKEIRHKRKEFERAGINFPYLHIDASQAGLYLNVNVEELGVDLMTLDAQKMYGPKGIGALFIRDGIKIEPMMLGGGQENNRRSGTENIPLIVGFAKAFELAQINKEKESVRLIKIRDEFFDSVKKFVPNAIINGHLKERLPNNINISLNSPRESGEHFSKKNVLAFSGFDGEMMVFRLDEAGIICSSSSACASGSGESEVVKKISSSERAKSTLRFSMGKETKKTDIIKLLNILKKLCQK